MSRLRTPIVTVITGEGGSGGALAIAVGDVVIALENAVYSVISPEGCASILWRTADEAATAAVAMRMTAADQQALGVVDIVVPGARRRRPHGPRRDGPPAQGDHRRPAGGPGCAVPSTSWSTSATDATGRSGAYTEVVGAGGRADRAAPEPRRSAARPARPRSARRRRRARSGRATNRRPARRSSACPSRPRPTTRRPPSASADERSARPRRHRPAERRAAARRSSPS